MLIRVMLGVAVASCWGQALGTWKMIPAKSRFGSGMAVKAITAKYESHSESEIWTFYQVHADGSSGTTSETLHFDGKEYPCGDLGLDEHPDTVISRKVDVRTAEVSYKKSGKVIRRMVRTVSADGKQMTLDLLVTTEKGQAARSRLVFDRGGTEE